MIFTGIEIFVYFPATFLFIVYLDNNKVSMFIPYYTSFINERLSEWPRTFNLLDEGVPESIAKEFVLWEADFQ